MEDIESRENSSFSENCTLWGLPCAQADLEDPIPNPSLWPPSNLVHWGEGLSTCYYSSCSGCQSGTSQITCLPPCETWGLVDDPTRHQQRPPSCHCHASQNSSSAEPAHPPFSSCCWSHSSGKGVDKLRHLALCHLCRRQAPPPAGTGLLCLVETCFVLPRYLNPGCCAFPLGGCPCQHEQGGVGPGGGPDKQHPGCWNW